MSEMWRNPIFKSLVFVGVWFVLGALTCVASVVGARGMAVALSTVLLFSLCLVGGYLYSKFEQFCVSEGAKADNHTGEKTVCDPIVVDKDLETL
jgi:hypothetical protein